MSDEQFSYHHFRLDGTRRSVCFDFSIRHQGRTYEFSEELEFPVPLRDTPAQMAGLRALHLALGISYYKRFVPPAITHPYAMEAAEAGFWNTVWRHGLGEFLFVNKLPADRLARFSAQSGETYPPGTGDHPAEGALLGIGGGKDSIVAGEVLKDRAITPQGFVLATGEQRGQAQAVADTMGVPLQAVKRTLDPRLIELRDQPGAYRGHIPISLIFGLVGVTLAVAQSKRYVVVANEASASIPGVMWQGTAVNHQWSKSFGFEQQLQAYVHTHITPAITYFSAVRPLTSIGVAKLFARYPAYYEVFTSDNFVFRVDAAKRPQGRWGLESPKSLSSFILLAPWIEPADMQRIFGRNFLDEPSLTDLFLELTGLRGHPPLDCVGTVDELVLSLNLLARQQRYTDSTLMRLATERNVLQPADTDTRLQAALELQPDQAFPADIANGLTAALQEGVQA